MAKGKEFKRLRPKSTDRFRVQEKPGDRIDYDQHKPVFSFYCMTYGSRGCLSSCDPPLKASVADRLLRLSQLRWLEILSQPKEGLGKENVTVAEFKVPLPPTVTPDVKSLMVFRISNSERMAGLRKNNIYHVLVVGKDLYDH